LTLLGQCISNVSFGIYFPKFTGTIYDVLSAPVAMTEVLLGYVGAAATKGMIIAVNKKNRIIMKGCSIMTSTKRLAVRRMMKPMIMP
ncbi:hypothetical protein ACC675_37300, partial [Rhizobium ruizarguesonis]